MATDLMYTTNPNEWTRLEGVYVNRKKPDPRITGANVNTVGMLFSSVRGPLTPQIVGSPAQATALYGGRDAGGGGAIVGQGWLACLNRAFSWPMVLCRVAAAAVATKATLTIDGKLTFTASSVGTWANGATGYGIKAATTAATDGNSNHRNAVVTYGGKTYTYANIDISTTGADNTASVVGNDPTNPVVITKAATGVPAITSAAELTGGTDGTVAASDFATAFPSIAHHPLTKIVVIADQAMNASATYAVIVPCGADAALPDVSEPTKMFVTCSTAYTGTAATEASNMTAAITTLSSNIIWCYNTSQMLDQSTGTLVAGGSHLDMAAILSQTAADVNPGEEDSVALLSGVSAVTNTGLTRGDLITLKSGGVAALEAVQDGFQFHSGVTVTGAEIADVRTEQYLTGGLAQYIKHDVKKKGTETRRRQIKAKVVSWLRSLQKAEMYVAPNDPDKGDAINVAWTDTFNERAANMGKLLTQVRTMPHLNYLVLETDMGTGVTVVQS